MDHRVRVKKVSFSDSDSCHDGDSDLESRLLSADDSILRQAHYKMLYRDDWEFGVLESLVIKECQHCNYRLPSSFCDEEDGLVGSTRLAVDVSSSSNASTWENESSYPVELKKTLVSFLLMALSFVLSFTSLAVIHEYLPDQQPALPDVVLNHSPYYPWALSISEIIIQVQIPTTIFLIVMHQHRSIVGRRVMMTMALLYGYRSITIFVTLLPKSNPSYFCTPKLDPSQISVALILRRVAFMLSGFGLTINGHQVYCGDFMYSGHTMIMVLTNLIVNEYTSKKLWWLQWIYFVSSVSGVVFLLLGKGHYTLDVIVAYWITTRLWYMLHSITYGRLSEAHFFNRLWWFPVFRWFENRVKPGKIPHGFNWPISITKLSCSKAIFSFCRRFLCKRSSIKNPRIRRRLSDS